MIAETLLTVGAVAAIPVAYRLGRRHGAADVHRAVARRPVAFALTPFEPDVGRRTRGRDVEQVTLIRVTEPG